MRGKSWEGSVGTGRARVRASFRTEHEALAWEEVGRAAILLGEAPPVPKKPSSSTLAALLDLTYNLVWAGTKGEQAALINAKSVVDILGPTTRVKEIDPQKLILELKKRGNAPGTINRKLAALSKMLKVAADAGMIPTKPVLPRLKEPQHRTRYLTKGEESELFSHLEEDVRCLCVFLIETGVRTGEARALQWSDVSRDSVHIRKSKGGTSRSVPLTAAAKDALSQVRHLPQPWGHISANQLTYAWRLAKEEAGLGGDREVVPHCLRHTCASRLVQAGVDLLTVQRWLGHSSLAMTIRYAHLAPNALDAGKQALEDYRQN